MTLHELSKYISMKDEEIPNLLKKSGNKGYCVLWYMKKSENAFTVTIHNTKKEAITTIKENKESFKWINKTKIIKL